MPLSVVRFALLVCLCAAGPAVLAQARAPQAADRSLETIRSLRADGDGDTVPDRIGDAVRVAGVARELLARTGVDPASFTEVIAGSVGPPHDQANVGRVLALRAGVPAALT